MRYLYILSVVLLLTANCICQESPNAQAQSQKETVGAVKFAEFGDVPAGEYGPKLRKFADELRKGNSVGYVVFYNNFNASPFRRSRYFVSRKMNSYASYINGGCGMGIRLRFVDGPFLEIMRTELWLVPPEGNPPLLEHHALATGEGPAFTGELIRNSDIDIDDSLIEKEATEENDEQMPENFGHRVATREDEPPFALKFLVHRKDMRGVLIFYLDDSEYDLDRARKIIDTKLTEYASAAKVDLRRIRIVFGGYRDRPSIESWAVSNHEMDPEPMPDEKIVIDQ